MYKKKLEKGAINLAAMDLKGEKDPATLKLRIQQLEKALEKANVLIYGLNAMIDYAPEGAQSPRAKKAWYQTVLLIKEKRITKMGVRPLCRLLGKSRQAFYKRAWVLSDTEQKELVVLELVAQIRRELPGLGLHKLYKCIYQPLRTNQIKMGRDKLNTFLRNHGLLISKKLRGPRTTQSNHMLLRYPDLAKHLEINRSEQLWVSDITYICINYDFNYLEFNNRCLFQKNHGLLFTSILN